jgi:hypothetical protein
MTAPDRFRPSLSFKLQGRVVAFLEGPTPGRGATWAVEFLPGVVTNRDGARIRVEGFRRPCTMSLAMTNNRQITLRPGCNVDVIIDPGSAHPGTIVRRLDIP